MPTRHHGQPMTEMQYTHFEARSTHKNTYTSYKLSVDVVLYDQCQQ